MQFGFTLKPEHSIERAIGLTRQAEAAGFTTRACKWVTVAVPNRRTGEVLRRVFVSGEFVK